MFERITLLPKQKKKKRGRGNTRKEKRHIVAVLTSNYSKFDLKKESQDGQGNGHGIYSTGSKRRLKEGVLIKEGRGGRGVSWGSASGGFYERKGGSVWHLEFALPALKEGKHDRQTKKNFPRRGKFWSRIKGRAVATPAEKRKNS